MSIENLPIKEQTDSESVAEKPEKTPENKPRKKRFKPDKKHVQGFIAGMLVMAILVTGVAAGIYPGFFTGTFTRQVGNTTLGQEVDLQAVACEPASIKAQAEYEQSFVLDIGKDKIKSFKTKNIQLGGLFEGMEVSAAKLTDSGKLSVSVKGKVQTPHAYGADRENPTADIYLMPDMLKDANTAYQANIAVTYPQLIPETAVLETKDSYNEKLVFTLEGDTFAKSPEKENVSLSGGFEGMSVGEVTQNGQKLTVSVSGDRKVDGNGIVTLGTGVLASGFSVDRVITIAGTPELVVNTVVTVEEPFDETLVIGVLNDFFAETLTADMFTLGGILKDAVVTDVEKTDGDQSVKLTVKASSMRSVGKGTVTVSGKGTQTGRMASGAVYVNNPEISVFHASADDTEDGKVYEIFSLGNDFEKYIAASDIVLKGSAKNMTVGGVEWLSGSHIRVTAKGTAGEGDAIVSIRSGVMGGITGAEATVFETDDLKWLGIGAAGEESSESGMSGQTGGFGFDAVADWCIGKLKGLILDGIKDGLKTGAETGLMYALREMGLVGPSVEDMLKEIQTSLVDLNNKVAVMQSQLTSEIQKAGLEGRVQTLLIEASRIDGYYVTYAALTRQIDAYKAAHPGAALDPNLQRQIDNLMDDMSKANLSGSVYAIADSMAGTGSLPSLISGYYSLFKRVYPFEHNSVNALLTLVREMTLAQSKGTLLYAEYCNYRGDTAALQGFTEQMQAKTAAQESRLPTGYQLNVRTAWGSDSSADIKVKCNANGKTYIIVANTYSMRQCIYKSESSNSPSVGYAMDYLDPGAMRLILTERFLIDGNNPYFFQNKSYAFIKREDINAIFACLITYQSGMPGSTYLVNYAGDNGWGMVGSWLYTDEKTESGSIAVYLFAGVMAQVRIIYNLTDYSYVVKDCWDLWDNYPDQHVKFILVQR